MVPEIESHELYVIQLFLHLPVCMPCVCVSDDVAQKFSEIYYYYYYYTGLTASFPGQPG